MTALSGGVVNYTKAGQMLQVQLGYFANKFPNNPAELHEEPSEFAKRWWEGFLERGNLKDAPRAGRPPKIPNIVAFHAAEIISEGYTSTSTVLGEEISEHKHFASIIEAIRFNSTLKQICDEFQATPQQLLAAMHRVAPELVQRSVRFRHKLTEAEKAHRVTVCYGLFQRYQRDHTMLLYMVFVDETTIMTHGLKGVSLKVWVNATDKSFRDYHNVPGKAWKPVKAHVIAAVTAHPQFEDTAGVVYVEFTTGTTKINRTQNLRWNGTAHVPDYHYLVSALHPLNACNARAVCCHAQPAYSTLQRIHVQQL